MHDLLNLKDKNIIITGASSGIGRQCAITASQLGASIALIGRNEQRLAETYSRLAPGNHHIVCCDVTDYEKMAGHVADSVGKLGKINGFIHSAGIEMTKILKSMTPADYETLFATNVVAGFELAKLISHKKHLSPAGASFIYISSVRGILGEPGMVGYCASKGALIPAVKAMALELVSKKIRVNCLVLGFVETEMVKNVLESLLPEAQQAILNKHPLGLGTPEDAAYCCAFLLSDLSRWITGSSMVVDGGYSAT
jgi:NAD(P)-dependent dehydrogenase (short-subunit alcohol dehydrogenase family)